MAKYSKTFLMGRSSQSTFILLAAYSFSQCQVKVALVTKHNI